MSLEVRIARLERRCRVLTLALAAAVLLPTVAFLTGAAQNVTYDYSFRTGRLDVVDTNGLLRARIGQMNDQFGLFLYDSRGQVRATIADSPDAASLSIAKDGGNIRLLANRQGADITLRDGRDVVRAVTTATAAGGELVIHANAGQVFTIPPPGN
jgi:hypothetical protein